MKKINILIILGLFVLLAGIAQPAQAALTSTWAPSVSSYSSTGGGKPDLFIKAVAQLDAAISKFEGLLNAYTSIYMVWNQPVRDYSIKKQLSIATHDLSSSLEQFNTALMEVYPTLSEEEQLAVREAYSSLGLYLEDLVVETNSVFGREVFRIEYGEHSATDDLRMNVLKSQYGDLLE